MVETARASVPNGCNPPVSWVIPRKSGGIASRTGAGGAGNIRNLNLAGGVNAIAPVVGIGNITQASVRYIIVANALLNGSGNASAAIFGTLVAQAGLTAFGGVAGTLISLVAASSALSGSSSMAGSVAGALQALANFAGTGNLSPSMAGKLEIIAGLVASGGVNGTPSAVWKMVGNLVAVGQFDAAIKALGNAGAGVIGTGNLAGNPQAKAFISGDVKVTGDMLTTSNVAESVWSALATSYNGAGTYGQLLGNVGAGSNPWQTIIESGITAEQVMRILMASAAGKLSGAPGEPVTIRDVADTKNRITATVDSAGNRTAITLDVS